MRRKDGSPHGVLALAVAAGLLLLFASTLIAQEQIVPSRAPLNPEFLRYMQARAEGRVQQYTPGGMPLGHIPAPIDLSYMKGMPVFQAPAKAIPATYDLRTTNKLTPIKDQGACGSCWAFAAFGSGESSLKPGESRDFAEWHMCQNHGWDWGSCDGGNSVLATAYLAQWKGPYNETSFPYPYYAELRPDAAIQKHVQDVYWLPDRASDTANDTVKKAVMDYGAVVVSFFVDDTPSVYFNAARTTYYCNVVEDTNHDVCIVGWDNNYSKTQFQKQPPGNGAFIIRNSWGTAYHNQGYFYMSYYDKNLKLAGCFNGFKATTNFGGFYNYDPLGCVNFSGYSSTTAWGANVFKATSTARPIKAVSTYFAMPNTAYQIYVYNNVTSTTNPRTGTLLVSKTGTQSLPGYHTITLPSQAAVTAGKKFSVVIKYTTPGYNYPVPIEYKYPGVTSRATAKAQQSYLSSNGTSWTDAIQYDPTQNVCIKAFDVKP